MPRLKKIVGTLLLGVSSMLIFFLLAEGITRVIVPNSVKLRLMHQPDEQVGYTLVPNFEVHYKTPEFDTYIKMNSEGLRDDEHQPGKIPGVYRILVLGDSFAFGLGANLEDSYTKILESLLNEDYDLRNPNTYEVINAGVNGYGTEQEYYYLQELGPRYRPDLVIVMFYANDIRDVGENIQSKFLKAQLKTRFYFLSYVRSRIPILLNMVLRPLRKELPELYQDQYPPHLQAGLKKTQEYLLKIRETSHSLGAETLLVLAPFCLEVDQSQWEHKRLGSAYTPGFFEKNMSKLSDIYSEFGQTNDIPTLSLLPTFRKSPQRSHLYFKRDPHWTREGHQLAAVTTYNFLKTMIINKEKRR